MINTSDFLMRIDNNLWNGLKRYRKILFLMLLAMVIMSNIATAKIKCEEKTKGGAGGGEKYLECEGGATIEQVFGTEYIQGQNGTLFVQVLNNDMQPFNLTLLCRLKVWYPNKTLYQDVGMFELNNSNNTIFYRDFQPLPNVSGVFIASADCFVPVFANSTLKYLRYNTTTNVYYIDINQGVSEIDYVITAGQTYVCSDKFTETINTMNYVDFINTTTYWNGKGVAGIQSDIKAELYKYNIPTDTYELLEVNFITNINLNTTRSTQTFSFSPKIFLNPTIEKLALDYCVKRISGGAVGYDFYFDGNTIGGNASMTKYTLTKNISSGYQEIKGAGEIHVTTTTDWNVFVPPLFTTAETNIIWIILFVIFVAIFIMIIWKFT